MTNRNVSHRVRRVARWGALAFVLLLSACAWSTHAEVPYGQRSIEAGGVMYYQVAPFLLVYSDGRGSVISEIHYLPDQTRLMKATFTDFIASQDSELALENGALTKAKSKGDGTVVPKAIIAAVEKALPLIAANAVDGTAELPAPYLYKIVVAGDSFEFIGGQGSTSVKVTLVPQETKS